MIQDIQDLAATTLANCAAFQTFVGAADAAAAANSIYQDALPPPAADKYTLAELIDLRPYGLVYTLDDSTGFRFTRVGTGVGCWDAQGVIVIRIERTTPDVEPAVADASLRTLMGDLVTQIADQCEIAGRLAATSISAMGPHRIADEDVQEQGDLQWFDLHVRWGEQP